MAEDTKNPNEESSQTREIEKPPLPAATANTIRVARTDEIAYFKVTGKGNMANAILVESMAGVMEDDGYWKFLFDLAECDWMDSTFMGTILGIALTVKGKKDSWVCVANANKTCTNLLTTLGVSEFVKMKTAFSLGQSIETEEIKDAQPPTKEQYLRLVKEAHENLMKIDQRNRQRFGNFLNALERELSG